MAADLGLADIPLDAASCPTRLPIQTLSDTPGAKSSPDVAVSLEGELGFVWIDDGVVFIATPDAPPEPIGHGQDAAIAGVADGLLATWNDADGLHVAITDGPAESVHMGFRRRGPADGLVAAADTPTGPVRLELDLDGRIAKVDPLPDPDDTEALGASGDWLLFGDASSGDISAFHADHGLRRVCLGPSCDRPQARILAADPLRPLALYQSTGQLFLTALGDEPTLVADAPRGTQVDLAPGLVAFTTPTDGPPGIYLQRPGAPRLRVVEGVARQPRLAVVGTLDCVVYADDQIRWACLDRACP